MFKTTFSLLDNSIKIIDELTGRILEGRRFGDGLHQALEAKENVKIEKGQGYGVHYVIDCNNKHRKILNLEF